MTRLKKTDKVMIISGKDKGKKADVIDILPKEGKIMLKDLGLVTRHVKARKQGDVAGIRKEEAYICFSKVMPVCPSCGQPCRVGATLLSDGQRARICKKCKGIM
jgi:large subunit ribosomal protein L24